jgi:hypothetical protein
MQPGLSLSSAAGYGHSFVKELVQKHPAVYGYALAVSILLVIILAIVIHSMRKKLGRAGFQTMSLSNLTTGGNNPQWSMGAADAGNYGPVHREITAEQASIYTPGYRRPAPQIAYSNRALLKPYGFGHDPKARPAPQRIRERLDTEGGGATAAACGASAWDPAAIAEAQALATTGALQEPTYAGDRLYQAVDAAFDTSSGLNNAEMAQLSAHSDLI